MAAAGGSWKGGVFMVPGAMYGERLAQYRQQDYESLQAGKLTARDIQQSITNFKRNANRIQRRINQRGTVARGDELGQFDMRRMRGELEFARGMLENNQWLLAQARSA